MAYISKRNRRKEKERQIAANNRSGITTIESITRPRILTKASPAHTFYSMSSTLAMKTQVSVCRASATGKTR